MGFGKRGRPPEDRVARRRAIYGAVAPLILEDGARRLSMRRAAAAAHLSVGGLYHYFPTKRDLVLYGLCPAALHRCCEDFQARFGHLAAADPRRYLDEGIEVVVEQVRFCRPALHAALELGGDSFWAVIETLLDSTALDFEANLRRLLPVATEGDLTRCGRAIRRAICAALLDKSVLPDELQEELRLLVHGHLARPGGAGPGPGAAPLSPAARTA
jgi:AcrR family transcriptional regulator